MGTRDPRVDAYITKAAPFAQPILGEIRERVHAACPDVVETIKWSFVSFEYRGLLCSMAAFKAHCTFGFWKNALVVGDAGDRTAMGSFGKLASVKDLPSKRDMAAYIKKAMRLNDEGVPAPHTVKPRVPKPPVQVPADLAAALSSNAAAKAAFEAFSQSHRREYVEWITEAKREETRERRIEKAVTMMAEGKSMNAKYETKKSAAR